MNDSDGAAVALLVLLGIMGLSFGIGYSMGSTFSKYDYVNQGRNEGIIFCTEKPKECKIEYTYLKLKENQK